MANSLGTLDVGIIAQRALELTFTNRPDIANITTDFSDQSLSYNQSVTTRLFSVPGTANFVGGTLPDKTDTDVAVTLNQWKMTGYTFTATEQNSTKRNLMEEAAQSLSIALGNSIIDAVAALWTTGNYAGAKQTSIATSSFGYSSMVKASKALVGRGCQGRLNAWLHQDTYEKLQNDTLANRLYSESAPGDVLRSRRFGNLAGIDSTSEYPGFFTGNSASSGIITGFVGAKDTSVYVSRAPKSPEELAGSGTYPGQIMYVTDPKTGFTVMVNKFVNADTHAVTMKLIWMYGVAVGNTNNGQIFITP